MASLDNTKLKGLFSRAYNAQTVDVQDEKDLKDYISKVFGDGTVNPDPSLLHQFNNLIVQTADELFKPRATDILSLLANFQQRPIGQIVQLKVPQKSKAKLAWAAHGTGVDLVRVGHDESVVAVPFKVQTGFYYEPLSLIQDSVEGFRNVVNMVVEAKLELYMKQVSALVQAAIASGDIPAANVVSAANVTLANYNKLASVLARYGGKPVFVADTLLIDKIAQQQATDSAIVNLLTDDVRADLLTALNPSIIGRTTAVNLVNPFTDENNNATELPVNEGYMFAGGVNAKPFSIVEYGGLRQMTEQDMEDERVKMKLTQEVAIHLVYGQAIGYVKDSAVTL